MKIIFATGNEAKMKEHYEYLIDEYGEDGLEIILDEYWSGY